MFILTLFHLKHTNYGPKFQPKGNSGQNEVKTPPLIFMGGCDVGGGEGISFRLLGWQNDGPASFGCHFCD